MLDTRPETRERALETTTIADQLRATLGVVAGVTKIFAPVFDHLRRSGELACREGSLSQDEVSALCVTGETLGSIRDALAQASALSATIEARGLPSSIEPLPAAAIDRIAAELPKLLLRLSAQANALGLSLSDLTKKGS